MRQQEDGVGLVFSGISVDSNSQNYKWQSDSIDEGISPIGSLKTANA